MPTTTASAKPNHEARAMSISWGRPGNTTTKHLTHKSITKTLKTEKIYIKEEGRAASTTDHYNKTTRPANKNFKLNIV